MKTVSIILLMTLTYLVLGCGYGSNYLGAGGAMPAITELDPARVNAGGPAFTLTIVGSNFANQAVVNWNNVPQSTNTTYVSASRLTIAVPASMIMNSGTVEVSVTNPGIRGQGYASGGTPPQTSMPMNFTID
jgi:IPT/TIG domain